MDTKKAAFHKAELETKIAQHVSSLIEEFRDETGLRIISVDINMVSIGEMGYREETCAVSDCVVDVRV